METTLKAWFIGSFELRFTLSNIKKILLEASEKYYNTEERIMSDNMYDRLREFYEKKSNEKLGVGALVVVGNTLDLSHSYSDFAGTLSKCKNIKELEEWAKNKKVKSDTLLVSIKADGHSITIEWKYNAKTKELELDKALTRGENGKGKDLTSLFKANLQSIPKPNLKFDNAVGYEAIITYSDFDKLSEETNGKYKNPRSAIGGIFSDKGKKYFPYITLVPIRIKAKDDKNFISRVKQIEIMTEMDNFDLLDFQSMYLEEVENLYEEHEKNRVNNNHNKISFMYDGLVVETIDEKSRKRLGYSSTEPNFATAIKFTPVEAYTTIEDILWSFEGHSATFTPVAIFKPVVIRGNTYKQVSLANYARFKEMNFYKGNPAVFTLRNDTLGYIDKLSENSEHKKEKKKYFQAPEDCPSCGDELFLTSTGIFLKCMNTNCVLNKIGDLYAFIEKIGIKNVGLEIIRELYANNIIKEVYDLPKIRSKMKDIEVLEGFGKTSANNIVKEIEKVLNNPIKDNYLLGSLNIPFISRSRSKTILEKVTIHEILNSLNSKSETKKMKEKLLTIPGIGNEIVDNLFLALENEHGERLNRLLESVQYIDSKVDRGEDFQQLSFCHTGGAEPLKDRTELKELLELNGHKLVSGVTSKTNYLINNDTQSTTVKNKKAKELNVPIINVQDAINMMKIKF
ncbi:MAG: DNA ligase [Bacteriophage sp.]|nr:MAG: DNA ligase [Bacteriophage sp.]